MSIVNAYSSTSNLQNKLQNGAVSSNERNVVSFKHTFRNWYTIDRRLWCVPSQHSLQSIVTDELRTLLKRFVGDGTWLYCKFDVSSVALKRFVVHDGAGRTVAARGTRVPSRLLHLRVHSSSDVGFVYALYGDNGPKSHRDLMGDVDDARPPGATLLPGGPDRDFRLSLPYEACDATRRTVDVASSSSSWNRAPLLAALERLDGRRYELRNVGIYGFVDQTPTGVRSFGSNATHNAYGVHDYRFIHAGGWSGRPLDCYDYLSLRRWNVQNRLQDYDLNHVSTDETIYSCRPTYAPCLWSTESPYSADEILTSTALPRYVSGINALGARRYDSLVWQPTCKNYGSLIREDAGSTLHAAKRLAGRIYDANEKWHDYFTVVPSSTNGRYFSEDKYLKVNCLAECEVTVSFAHRERALEKGKDDPAELQNWIEIVGKNDERWRPEAHPNMKCIDSQAGMIHFNF